MSFKLRNTLILLFMLLLMIGFGIWRLVFHFPGQIEQLRSEIETIDQNIVQIPQLEEGLEQTRVAIIEREEMLASLDKTVEANVTMADAFAYLDDIQDRFGSLAFTLTYTGERETQGFGMRRFTLAGEGIYRTIFNLIWAFERGPKLFMIESIKMRGVEGAREKVGQPTLIIPFEMSIRALYADVTELPPIKLTLSDVRPPRIRNMFYPLISKNLSPNTRGLIEVERAELRAILPNRAVVASHTGQVRVLAEGDEVYLGYLTKIDQSENMVEFTLNKGGIVERFRLNMHFTPDGGN